MPTSTTSSTNILDNTNNGLSLSTPKKSSWGDISFLSEFSDSASSTPVSAALKSVPTVDTSAFADRNIGLLNTKVPKVKSYEDIVSELGIGNFGGEDTKVETPWYQDAGKMKGYAGLASSFVQVATLIPQLRAYRQALKDSEFNYARAQGAAKRIDQRNANLSGHTTNG